MTRRRTRRGELLIEMTAMTDRATLCNLAQHTYWNLAGHDSGGIDGPDQPVSMTGTKKGRAGLTGHIDVVGE